MRVVRRVLCAAAVLLLPTYVLSVGEADPPKKEILPKAGTVLSEESKRLGHGYRLVYRSQVNSPGLFEAVGHFAFAYYKEEKLCQCDEREIAISPTGAHAIFTDVSTGKLILFREASRTRTALTTTFAGYPIGAVWEAGHVMVTLETYRNGAAVISKRAFAL